MTDLQCPATAVLLDGKDPPPPWLERLRVAGWLEPDPGPAPLAGTIGDTADQYRGETFVVTATSADITAVLKEHRISAVPPVVLEVDSEGWRVKGTGLWT